MEAALNLVKLSQATHTAINTGDWNDSKTWKDGKIPTQNAKVYIPKDISVTYGSITSIRHDTVRVDGTLKFSSNHSSKLFLDTMVVTKSGELMIGDDENPIAANHSVDIIFRSNTDITSQDDPLDLRRGLLSMGKVTINGIDKLDHIRLKYPALAGDQELVLDLPPNMDQPQGWNVGDRLVLGGTQYVHRGSNQDNSRFQDEVLEITHIDGNKIRFRNLDITSDANNVLRFDHQLPDVAESDQLNLYVANTSRNITFQSEDGEDTAIARRGHIMLMQNPNVVVKNAAFVGLGRSDKTRLVDEPGQNVDGSIGHGTNPRGRYALHLHQLNNNLLNNEAAITDQPAIVSGIAIVNSPGWGLVNHGGTANFSDNVVFDVVGAAYVSEGGAEQGVWNNNISIKTTGVEMADAIRTDGDRKRLFDHGFQGDGYWIQGAAQVALLDNIAISSNESGLTIFGDTLEPEKHFRDAKTIAVKHLPKELQRIAKPGQEYVDITDIPLKELNGLESYNARVGFKIWGHLYNIDGETEFTSPDRQTAHNLRSNVSNIKLWGNRRRGLEVQYSSQIDFNNGIIIGSPNDPKYIGVANNATTFNNRYNNLTIKGFEQGFAVPLNGNNATPKDYLKSELSNSTFSQNTYHLGKALLGAQSTLIDFFPSNFELKDNQFSTNTSNQSPIANFSSKGIGGFGIALDASQSLDPDSSLANGNDEKNILDKGIVAYAWDFDQDGKIDATGRNATYQYESPGQKTVTLSVWDRQGSSTTLSQSIQVSKTAYQTPFLDGSFDQGSFIKSWKSYSRWADQGWYATKGVRSDDSGAAVLSTTLSWGSGLGQVVQTDQVNRGTQTLKFSLKNFEGAEPIDIGRNNEITIQLWGINGQFNNKSWLANGPEQVGTLSFQKTQIFSEIIGGRNQPRESFDWRNYIRKVDLGSGYQFLLFQVNTQATRDVGDLVAIDNIFLTGAPDAGDLMDDPVLVETGTDGNDLIHGSDQQDKFKGFRGDDHIFGNNGNDVLVGGHGNDTLVGGSGHDVIMGATSLSEESDLDRLVGGAGRDRFLLGNRVHRFYVNETTNGEASFAWIQDFNISEDKILMKGDVSNYRLGAYSIEGKSGTGITFETTGSDQGMNNGDLVAFIEGHSNLSLSENYFKYL